MMTRISKIATGILDLRFFIAGVVALICSLFPLRVYDLFVKLSQIDFITPVYIALVISLSILFICRIIFIKDYTINLTAADILVMVYLVYTAVRFVLQSQTINPESFFEFIVLVGLYFIFRKIKANYINYLLPLFSLAGIAQIAYGIANQTQYFMPGYGLPDVTGVFNNTGILGGFIAIAFVATLGLPIGNTESKRFINRIPFLKILRFFVLFLFFIQLVASHSRAAWVGCVAGCVYFVVFRPEGIYRRFIRKRLFRKLLMGVVLSLSVVALVGGLYTVRKDSADGRLLIWRVSLDMIKDKPVFGHGIDGFKANYMEYQARYFAAHPDSPFTKLADENLFAFNEVLKLVVEKGFVGLLLVGALGYILFFKNRTSTPEAIAIKATLMTLFVFGCFSYPTDVFQMNVILVMLIALVPLNQTGGWTLRLPFAEFLEKRNRVGKIMLRAGLLLMYGSVVTIFIVSILRYNTTCRNWDKGLKVFSNNQSYNDIRLLRSCYPVLSNNGVFLSNYGKALTLSGAYREAIPILIKANKRLSLASNYMELGKCYRTTGNIADAKKAWIRASRMIPSLFTPLYLIAKTDYETGKLPEARNLARKLLDKKPKVRSPETDSIQAEMARMVEATNQRWR